MWSAVQASSARATGCQSLRGSAIHRHLSRVFPKKTAKGSGKNINAWTVSIVSSKRCHCSAVTKINSSVFDPDTICVGVRLRVCVLQGATRTLSDCVAEKTEGLFRPCSAFQSELWREAAI